MASEEETMVRDQIIMATSMEIMEINLVEMAQ